MYEFYWEDEKGIRQRKLMVIGCDKMSVELSLADYRCQCKSNDEKLSMLGWIEYLNDQGIDAYALPDPMGSFEFVEMK